MTNPQGPVNSLGIARGKIGVDLSDLQQNRQVALQVSRDIGEGFKKSFDGASKSVGQLKNEMGSLSKTGLGALPQSALNLKARFTELRTEGKALTETVAGTSGAILALGSRLKSLPANGTELGSLPKSALDARARFSQLNKTLDETKAKVSTLAGRKVDIAPGLKQTVSVVNNLNQSLESTAARLRTIQGELAAVAAGGAALAFLGLRAADNLQNVQVRFRALAGDQERAVELMQEVADAANQFRLPVQATQTAFVGLIPAIRETNGDIGEYVNLVSRLASLNPQEGVAGAVFAVREALSSGGTDLVSLSERFNISRIELRALTEETGDFAAALDILLDQQGATNEALEEYGDSLALASARAREAGLDALRRAFLPQLDALVGLLDGASSLLKNIPDSLLVTAGSAITATAAFAGLALGVSQVLTAYENLKKAGVLNAAGTKGLLAGTIAVGGLLNAPTFATDIVRGIGGATGNERLQEQTVEDTNNTIRQAGVILAVGILDVGRLFAKGIVTIIAGLQTIPAQIEYFKGQWERATGQLILAFGNLVQSISNAIPGNPLGDSAQNLIADGATRIAEGEARIAAANETVNAAVTTSIAAVDEMFDSWTTNMLGSFGVIETEAQRLEERTNQEFSQLRRNGEKVFDAVAKGIEELVGGIQDRVKQIESAVQFQTQLNQLSRTGTVEQVTDRVAGLQDERAAIEALLPELQGLARGNNEAAQSLRAYQSRLTEIDTQIQQLGRITPDVARRELDALSQAFADDIRKLETQRGDDLTALATKVREDLSKLDSDLAKEFTDARKDEIKAVSEFQDEREDIEKEHAKRLLEITRKGRESVIDAASRLDAAGVRAAMRAVEEETRQEAERYAEQNERNAERLLEVRENLAEERREILMNYEQRRNDILAQGNIERQAIVAKYNAEIATRTQAYNLEAQQLNQYINQRLRQQQQAINAELQAQSAGYGAMVRGANEFASAMGRIASNMVALVPKTTSSVGSVSSMLAGRTSSTSTSSTNTGSVGRVLSQTSYKPSITSSFKSIASFNDGGVAQYGGSGEALAYVRNKERVLTPQQNSNFERMVMALTASNGAPNRAGLSIDNISVDITGADSLEDMVRMTVEQTLIHVEQALING